MMHAHEMWCRRSVESSRDGISRCSANQSLQARKAAAEHSQRDPGRNKI